MRFQELQYGLTLTNTSHSRKDTDNLLIFRPWLQKAAFQLLQDVCVSSVLSCCLPWNSPSLLC